MLFVLVLFVCKPVSPTQKAAMRAGHGNNRTPAHIADNNENTLPRLNGGVIRNCF